MRMLGKKSGGSPVQKDVETVLLTLDSLDYEATMADRRYEVISAILPQICVTCVKNLTASDLIDRVVTNRYWVSPFSLR